jgi:hypothetical protein
VGLRGCEDLGCVWRINVKGPASGSPALRFFVDGDAKGLQKTLVLRGETDAASGPDFLRLAEIRFGGFVVIGFVALVEADCRFQNEEYIVTGALNFADRLCNALGIGQRVVDRVTQVLHQAFETFFHVLPLSFGRHSLDEIKVVATVL